MLDRTLARALCSALLVAIAAWIGSIAAAQEPATTPPAASSDPGSATAPHVGSADRDPHPVLTSNGNWVPIALIVIGGMFVAAAVIGPVVRANLPEELPPPAHSHDEPPGASHHHGRGGTINPEPEQTLGH